MLIYIIFPRLPFSFFTANTSHFSAFTRHDRCPVSTIAPERSCANLRPNLWLMFIKQTHGHFFFFNLFFCIPWSHKICCIVIKWLSAVHKDESGERRGEVRMSERVVFGKRGLAGGGGQLTRRWPFVQPWDIDLLFLFIASVGLTLFHA